LVVDLTLVQSGLLDLNLFIQYLQLLVTLNQLGAQDVTLIDNHLIVFALLLLLLLSFSDNVLEASNINFLGLDHVVT
jgi:hypothetical protein